MAFNVEKSYTEYNITESTSDFQIGFEFDQSYQIIEGTLDNEALSETGRTLTVVSENAVTVEPAVESGTVRLQRVTNIDQPLHDFGAGALFAPSTLTENFEHILQSQQEVRDNFENLEGIVVPMVEGLEDALEQADAAAKAADAAAAAAAEAAASVVTIEATRIIDSSGTNQQVINDTVSADLGALTSTVNDGLEYIGSHAVNIAKYYTNDLGVAIENAHAEAVSAGLGELFLEAGRYDCLTTADITLSRNISITLSADTIVYMRNKVDFISATMTDKTLFVRANGAVVYVSWTTGATGDNAILRLDSRTMSKSAEITNLTCLRTGSDQFTYGIYGGGLNYSYIKECLIQATYPVYVYSHVSGVYGHAMGSIIEDCYLHGVTACITLESKGTLACEGWDIRGGELLTGGVAIQAIDSMDSGSSYLPPLLRVSGVHMNATQFLRVSTFSRVIVNACDLQARMIVDNPYNGLIELDGVQSFHISGGTSITKATVSPATNADAIPAIYVGANSRGFTSAFFNLGDAVYWLVQDAPLIQLSAASVYTGRIDVRAANTSALNAPIIANDNAHKVLLAETIALRQSQANSTAFMQGTGTFDSSTGVLTLNDAPAIGAFYNIPLSVVPTGSTINQVKNTGSIGKLCTVYFEGSNLTFTHGTYFYQPTERTFKTTGASTLTMIPRTTDISRVLQVTNVGVLHTLTAAPASSTASGIAGQVYFNGTYLYVYVNGTGWVRAAASTF